MNKSPFKKYNDQTITVFRWVIIPIATMGQALIVIEKAIQGPMKSGLLGLPNIVGIASSIAFIWLMGWMFLGLSKECTRRKNITNHQQDASGNP